MWRIWRRRRRRRRQIVLWGRYGRGGRGSRVRRDLEEGHRVVGKQIQVPRIFEATDMVLNDEELSDKQQKKRFVEDGDWCPSRGCLRTTDHRIRYSQSEFELLSNDVVSRLIGKSDPRQLCSRATYSLLYLAVAHPIACTDAWEKTRQWAKRRIPR